MENSNDTESGRLPVRRITANQVVAWNLARYRRARKLTQDEFGAMIGWSKGAVSEAERSWDGKRTREFDAQTLTVLAIALEVPVIALLLPPDGDGLDEQYAIDGGTAFGIAGMADYLLLAVLPDGNEDSESPAMDLYTERYTAVVRRYLRGDQADRAMRWVARTQPPGRLRELAEMFHEYELVAADALGVFRQLNAAAKKQMEER